MNIGVYMSFPVSVFIFFRQLPRNGIGGSPGSSVFNFFEDGDDHFDHLVRAAFTRFPY